MVDLNAKLKIFPWTPRLKGLRTALLIELEALWGIL